MRKTSTLFACLTALLFAACSENEPNATLPESSDIRFRAEIENGVGTRASGTTWDANDAIGVYMKAAGGNLTAATENNVKYTTVGNGNTVFTPATTGIEFPKDGSNVDFISYYPYQTTITGYSYPINVAKQSDLSAIDLLYSNNAVATNMTNPAVTLNFKHMLSQVILNVSASSSVGSLTGLALSIQDLKVDGTFDLATGTVALGSTVATLTPTVSSTYTINAILVPGQDLATAKFTFTLNGKTYKWEPATMMLESGKKYTYPIQLTTSGVVDLNPSGTIEDWIEGNTGGAGVVLTPTEDPVFVADKASASVAATAATETLQLTTQDTQAWTAASSDASWLTVSPTSGTGSASLTVSATANTAEERSATITVTPTGSDFSPVTFTVTQAAGTVAPSSNLVFPGSDFEDWSAFIGSLNSYGIPDYTVQATTGGRDGKSALHINGTPTTNAYIFTASAASVATTATKLVLYLKGTAAGKSLSFNLYTPDTAVASGYYKYNLGVCTEDVTITSAAPATGANSYTGSIDTGGKWVKVTLDLTGYTWNTSGTIFALKVGKDAPYDLYVDDITFE